MDWTAFLTAGGSTILTLVFGTVIVVLVFYLLRSKLDRNRQGWVVGGIIALVVLTVVLNFFSTRQQSSVDLQKAVLDANQKLADTQQKAKEAERKYDNQIHDCRATLLTLHDLMEQKLAIIEDLESARALAQVMVAEIDRATLCFPPGETTAPSSAAPPTPSPETSSAAPASASPSP